MHNSSLFATGPGLLALLALTIVALYFRATLIASFLLLVLFLNACAYFWGKNVLNRTEVSIADGQTACHAGDTLPLTLCVRSRSFFPLIWLDVLLPTGTTPILCREGDNPDTRFEPPESGPVCGVQERFVWLLWQQEITCEETLRAARRGVVRITSASLQAGDGLGMAACHRWAPLPRPVRLSVYPRLIPVDAAPFLQLLSDAEAGARGQTEDVTLLKSSRPYQHGDPMKRINWRYLAMTGRMEVNQHELITPGCLTFLLDMQSFCHSVPDPTSSDPHATKLALREDAFEQMISLIASILRALCDRGLRFALVLPGYGQSEALVCPPGSGETAFYQAMEALAAVCYACQRTRLPGDELQRMRRKLGVMHVCAYNDASALPAELEALGLTRAKLIACVRSSETRPGSECLLMENLTAGQEGGAA